MLTFHLSIFLCSLSGTDASAPLYPLGYPFYRLCSIIFLSSLLFYAQTTYLLKN